MAFGRNNAVSIAFEGKDNVSPVVRGIKNSMDGFKRDAKQGFGIAAGFNIMSTAMNLAGQAAGAAIDYVGDAINLASDFEEQVGKIDVVFGTSAESIKAWGETTATSIGMSNRAALEAAGTLGAMFSGMGIVGDEAANLSMNLVQLAADLGSFYNVSESEALQALRSGLVGEAEPLRRYGILLSAAAVNAKALELGLAGTIGEISESDKVLARIALIEEGAAVAQGNFALTADGAANATKSLNAQLEDLQTEVGAAFLPLWRDTLIFFRDEGVPALSEIGDEFGEIGEALGRIQEGWERLPQPLRDFLTGQILDTLNPLTTITRPLDLAGNLINDSGLADWVPDLIGDQTEPIEYDPLSSFEYVVTTRPDIAPIEGWAEQVTEDIRVAVFETTAEFDINEVMMSAIGQATQTGLDWSEALFAGHSGRISGENGKTKRGKGSLYKSIEAQLRLEKNNVRDLLRDPKLLQDIQTLYQEHEEFLNRKLGAAQGGSNTLASLYIGRQLDATSVNLDGIAGAGVAGATQFATSWNTAFEATVHPYIRSLFNGELESLGITATVAVQVTGDRGLLEWLVNNGVNPGSMPPWPGGADGKASTPYPKAMGGDVAGGRTYLVGENGPEVLTLGPRGGSVTPNHALGSSGPVAVYLDGRLVGRLLDERLGRSFGGERGTY